MEVLLPAVLSLVGVGLGTAGSLLGQHLSARVTARQRQDAHRAELKASIMRFLELTQRVRSDPQLIDQLWLAQHEVDLMAVSEELRGATYRFARGLTRLAQGEEMDSGPLEIAFMDAARVDLRP